MDYRILGMTHERVRTPGMWIVVELRQRLAETWTEFQRSIVGSSSSSSSSSSLFAFGEAEAIEQWRNRLRSCVRAEEGHFENFL